MRLATRVHPRLTGIQKRFVDHQPCHRRVYCLIVIYTNKQIKVHISSNYYYIFMQVHCQQASYMLAIDVSAVSQWPSGNIADSYERFWNRLLPWAVVTIPPTRITVSVNAFPAGSKVSVIIL